MRFRIMHESPGRLRLRADVPSMSTGQADLLDAWLREQAGVDDVAVHERTCGVIGGLCAAHCRNFPIRARKNQPIFRYAAAAP